MYSNSLCINSFDNTNVWPAWDSSKLPPPVDPSVTAAHLDPRFSLSHEMVVSPSNALDRFEENNREAYPFGSDMALCHSSSTSSSISSPPLPQSCFFLPSQLTLPSHEPIYAMSLHHEDIASHPFYYPVVESSIKYAKNKIYDCTICPRSFARKHDLQRHIRVHTGAKPYYCLNCEKAFARTDALKRHLRMEESCRMSPVIQTLKNVGMRRYRNL
ncbi:hypothetical protein BY458DRAFT_511800 [Sporodiniella umbellata]|nr:hypothetical protein BY458DRAFT_511800 [Sporodiniella umbellata]